MLLIGKGSQIGATCRTGNSLFMFFEVGGYREMRRAPQWHGVTAGHSGIAERRRGLRIRQNRPIKVFEPTVNRYFQGQTQDISSAGLRIELPASTSVEPGSFLNVHVGLSVQGQSLANRRQMISARVVWVEREIGGNGGRLMAGVEFISSIAAHLDAA